MWWISKHISNLWISMDIKVIKNIVNLANIEDFLVK